MKNIPKTLFTSWREPIDSCNLIQDQISLWKEKNPSWDSLRMVAKSTLVTRKYVKSMVMFTGISSVVSLEKEHTVLKCYCE